MSGRSAYVRKKITETKLGDGGGDSRRRASNADSDNATISEYPTGATAGLRQDRERPATGVGVSNARFLKFSDPSQQDGARAYHDGIDRYGNSSSGSQSGSSLDGRREGATTSHLHRPLDDFAYARARRPVIKTEDVSGIEKSGLRTVLDKKSDEVRKGLVKAFTFKKKDKKGHDAHKDIEFRSQSSATVRPSPSFGGQPNDWTDTHDADVAPVQDQEAALNSGLRWEEMVSPQSPSKPISVPERSGTSHVKRWIGAGRPVQRWNKLRKDPELWDPNGDVLVFFGPKGQHPRPNPSFRLSSHIIEATGSRYLITLLREGSTEEDIHIPPSPSGAPPMLQRHGRRGQQLLAPGGFGHGGQPTPPVSEDSSLWETDGQISYELYFPSPPNMTYLDELRHHITTRNVFALLYHASFVGLSLYQALSDLHSRLESYMPPEADNVGTIVNYLLARGIDDVRNDAETAVSLLAWSEGSEVRWEEGWRESFLHCAGMYSRLEACSDFRHITPITRALLERACLETQLRVQAAEERLAGFQYSDMWPPSVAMTANVSGPVAAAPAKAAADRLQNFFVQYYTREFGTWPPLSPPRDPSQPAVVAAHGRGGGDGDIWLTRTVVQVLQKDFAALYDYLVNRDIVWDESEARSGRKWMMVSESGNRAFEADSPELPMTDMLIEFDNKHRLPHIPHPYPLVPESIPPSSGANSSSKESSTGGMFGSKSSKKNANSSAVTSGNGRAGAIERRIQLAYTEATNICILGPEFAHSDLIDSFAKFEKADHIGEIDPATARRGRWVLIYGILQTLASVAVDAPNIRYRDGVSYHLSPRLKGAKMPPWKANHHHHHHHHHHHPPAQEAAHELSHCWTVPATWTASSDECVSNSGAESSADDGPASPMGYYGYAGRGYPFPTPQPRPPPRQQRRIDGRPTRNTRSSRTPLAAAGTYTPFSSATSIMSSSYPESVSDAGSSGVRSLTAPLGPLPPTPLLARRGGRFVQEGGASNASVPGVGVGGGRLFDPLDEGEWGSPLGGHFVDGGNKIMASLHGGQGQAGGLLRLDDEVGDGDGLETAHNTAAARSGMDSDGEEDRKKGGDGGRLTVDRPLLSGGGSGTDTDSVGPVIRDFDDLDVIDDEAP
ncbi:Choriogenin Hminor [Madurella fahalii]|uniref:Choriogenin Hminor n=1 Tax=Madurella fahalii TaxID=1157608 RepID=A0ABQ0GIY1_9PEZI